MTETEQQSASTSHDPGQDSIEEVKQALGGDSTRLGEVWARPDKTPQEIAEELDVPTSGFVYNYRRIIAALVNGEVPTKPTSAKQVASALRGFAKRHEDGLSGPAIERLQRLAERCDRVANDPLAIAQEDSADQQRTEEVEKRGTSGIHVYTFPHYWRHPVLATVTHDGTGAEGRERTYFKVGVSGRDVKERIQSQMRGTAVPEEPVLFRIYTATSMSHDDLPEKRFHEHLRAADHGRNVARTHGREWFLTHLDFLDDTADLLGLSKDYERPEDE